MKITKILQTWASLLMIETKDIFYHLKNGGGSALYRLPQVRNHHGNWCRSTRDMKDVVTRFCSRYIKDGLW